MAISLNLDSDLQSPSRHSIKTCPKDDYEDNRLSNDID